jgi:hypothetical protein
MTRTVRGEKAELVPHYAYDQRSELLVYIRDNGADPQTQGQTTLPGMPPNSAVSHPFNNPRPNGIYRFNHPQDLFKFQAKLTGEAVVLDISTVKMVRLARVSSRSVENYSSARVQIWHEPRSRRSTQSDVASIVTAGTALSGPVREKVVANSSRLLVFLGRSEEYLSVFGEFTLFIDLLFSVRNWNWDQDWHGREC